MSNIQKLFTERIEVFSSVDFSKISIVTGIIKITLKVQTHILFTPLVTHVYCMYYYYSLTQAHMTHYIVFILVFYNMSWHYHLSATFKQRTVL